VFVWASTSAFGAFGAEKQKPKQTPQSGKALAKSAVECTG
jgi:hypothetical protein